MGVVYGSLEECSDRRFPSLYSRLQDYDILSFIRNVTFGDEIEPVEVKGTILINLVLCFYLFFDFSTVALDK